MGRLRARGVLRLAQFWPVGRSDADTTNITIALELEPAFVFRPDRGVETPTRVFEDAHWDDRGTKKLVLGRNRDTLRVRLQGIDAPELHYGPPLPGRRDFRQHLAETTVFALRAMLLELAAGAKELRADVISFVDSPNEVFDVYGRYVGNIMVYADGFGVDLNYWLLEHGWAVPGLYNSMTERELAVARSLSAKAARENLGLHKGRDYRDRVVPFDYDLVERRGVDPAAFRLYDDRGPTMNPKFFRRQVHYELKERLSPSGKSFREALLADASYKALTWETFAGLPASVKESPRELARHAVKLGSLMGARGSLPRADDLIYVEAGADITNSRGEVIREWDF
jgi:endonuclease YncB( thermonuclease family)